MEFSELITMPKVDGATLYRANQPPIEGTLCVTPFYLILSSRRKDPPEELWLLHRSVDCVERKVTSEIVTLKCKDFQILMLSLPSLDACNRISNSIEALSNLDNEALSYPFHNNLSIDIAENGWLLYSIRSEFNALKNWLGSEWRLSGVNQDYKVCETYPSHVIVLKCITDEMIVNAASFRHKGRFPILAYYHKQNGMVLMRCSQPMGRGGIRRNKYDEKMVNGVLNGGRRIGERGGVTRVGEEGGVTRVGEGGGVTSVGEGGGVTRVGEGGGVTRVGEGGGVTRVCESNGGYEWKESEVDMGEEMKVGDKATMVEEVKEDDGGQKARMGQRMRGYIVDIRSSAVMKMDAAKGGGTEAEQFYPLWRAVTHSMQTPQALQESLVKLIEACLDAGCSTDKWLNRLEASDWISSVGDALFCSQSVARYIDEGGSVLLRGGGEVDGQLVVSSLVQLLLNPECRSLVGFEALVEKEWIQAGHPFSSRCIKGAFSCSKRRTEAPTFLLFLDCVYQLWQQFSCSFQFNTFFLSALFKHAYASQFGTFLFDNERERVANGVRDKTVSLWSYINSAGVIKNYLNPLYTINPSVLQPSSSPHALKLWTQVYQGWQRFIPRQTALWLQVEGIITSQNKLKTEVIKMRKYVVKLEKEALKRNLLTSHS